jgi:hypothetical protein
MMIRQTALEPGGAILSRKRYVVERVPSFELWSNEHQFSIFGIIDHQSINWEKISGKNFYSRLKCFAVSSKWCFVEQNGRYFRYP